MTIKRKLCAEYHHDILHQNIPHEAERFDYTGLLLYNSNMAIKSFLKRQISKLIPGKKQDAVSPALVIPAVSQQSSQYSRSSNQQNNQNAQNRNKGRYFGRGRRRPFSRQQKQRKPQNNYAFIDSQNLNLSIRSQKWILDFRRFRIYLKQKYGVTKAFIFIGQMDTNQNLYDALKNFGYILIYKPTLNLPDGTVKGNVDSEMVLHAMIEYNNYDKAVIVTSDGDFYCLVDYLKTHNKLEKLVIPYSRRYSSLLQKFHNDTLFMDGLRNVLRYKSRKIAPGALGAEKTEPQKPA